MDDKEITIKPPWRSPDEKPETDLDVLVTMEAFSALTVHPAAWIKKPGAWIGEDCHLIEGKAHTVVAWMPMPPPCGEEAEQACRKPHKYRIIREEGRKGLDPLTFLRRWGPSEEIPEGWEEITDLRQCELGPVLFPPRPTHDSDGLLIQALRGLLRLEPNMRCMNCGRPATESEVVQGWIACSCESEPEPEEEPNMMKGTDSTEIEVTAREFVRVTHGDDQGVVLSIVCPDEKENECSVDISLSALQIKQVVRALLLYQEKKPEPEEEPAAGILLPCPFCGGKPWEARNGHIYCEGCDVTGRRPKDWNRREPPCKRCEKIKNVLRKRGPDAFPFATNSERIDDIKKAMEYEESPQPKKEEPAPCEKCEALKEVVVALAAGSKEEPVSCRSCFFPKRCKELEEKLERNFRNWKAWLKGESAYTSPEKPGPCERCEALKEELAQTFRDWKTWILAGQPKGAAPCEECRRKDEKIEELHKWGAKPCKRCEELRKGFERSEGYDISIDWIKKVLDYAPAPVL